MALGLRELAKADFAPSSSVASAEAMARAAQHLSKLQSSGSASHALDCISFAGDAAVFCAPETVRGQISKDYYIAIGRDAEETYVFEPLWKNGSMTDGLDRGYASLRTYFEANPTVWEFWGKWYHAVLTGDLFDWEFCGTLIEHLSREDWNAGPEHVAERIREIEQNYSAEALSNSAAAAQSARILTQRRLSITVSNGLKDIIDAARSAYLREISNSLPDALEPLMELPPIFASIANVLESKEAQTEKEAQLIELIRQMAQTIAVLNNRLTQTHAELRAVKAAVDDRSPRRLFAEAFYEKAGEGAAGLITSKMLWGGLISGSVLLLGADAEALTNGLSECFRNIIEPEAPGGPANLLRPTTDV